ncbi:MAG: zinc ribbon domain-containing protein [Phycisphaerales bacterium]|nr:zinc ribbon domain-containing protein [Phycisphaerales bacterium]
MPLYDYECKGCGHEFEALMPSADSAPAQCPKCRKSQTERRVSLIAAPRSGSDARSAPRVGGCGRCGDPSGPCSGN